MTISALMEREELKFDVSSNHAFSFALHLLMDDDPDIVFQAVQVLDHLKDPRALETLRFLLCHSDPNVVQSAIMAIGHLGDERAIPDLTTFLKTDQWLKMAAVQALGDLRSSLAVRPLAKLLTDFIIGPLASESLARIGGTAAFKVLAKHWLKFHKQLDTETVLSLLVHVLEGISKKIPKIPGLRKSVIPYLDDHDDAVRTSAARCILALGSGSEDKKALSIMAYTASDPGVLPACLKYRRDLIPHLLNMKGVHQTWGFQLASLFPKGISVSLLSASLGNVEHYEHLDCIVHALVKIKDPAIVPAVLDLYLRVPIVCRYLLTPLLLIHKKQIRSLLIDLDVDDETRLVISAYSGISPICIALEILDLPQDSCIMVISQITDCKTILKCLPWNQWLENNPVVYASIAAEVAVKANLRELLPLLRKTLTVYPVPQIIRAVGELGDQESMPILISHLNKTSFLAKVLILESMGRIGGQKAREELRKAAMTLEYREARIAYKSLSQCATEEDSAFFRDAVTNADWYVRLACAEFFVRYSNPENLEAMAGFSSDPVSIVAQRALSFLKSRLRDNRSHQGGIENQNNFQNGFGNFELNSVLQKHEYCS